MNRPDASLPAHLAALLAHPDEPLRVFLEHRVLPGWLPQRRWFRAKSRPLRSVAFEAVLPCGDAAIAILRVTFADGFADSLADDAPHKNGFERYLLPLILTDPKTADTLPEAAVLGPVTTPAGERFLIDACWDADFRQAFAERLCGDDGVDGVDGEHGNAGGDGGDAWRGRPAEGLPADVLRRAACLPSRVLGAEQSNTAFVYEGGPGDISGAAPGTTGTAGPETSGMFVKLYRRLEPGVHPEPEMLRFLRERTGYRGVPGFLAALEWTPRGGAPATIALAQELVSGGRDAWTHMVEALGKTFGETSGAVRNEAAPPEAPPYASPALAGLTSFAARLGAAVGGLHAALGSRADDPAFAPAAMAAGALDAVRADTREGLRTALGALETKLPDLSPETAALARDLLAYRARLDALLSPVAETAGDVGTETTGLALRTHGDLHLGQILVAGDDIRILDFEGEPGRPLAAARRKQSPLRDVAGMLRSFHYAAHVAERDFRSLAERDIDNLAAHPTHDADIRAATLARAFLEAYYAVPGLAPLLPRETARRDALLRLHVLEKAVYELRYELDNRPDWISIPLQGLVSLCNEPV